LHIQPVGKDQLTPDEELEASITDYVNESKPLQGALGKRRVKALRGIKGRGNVDGSG